MRRQIVIFTAILLFPGFSSVMKAADSRAADQLLRRMLMGEFPGSAAQERVDLSPHELRAGPVRLKLQDGQLRYIHVGDKEIVRRIYFAVRDGNWNTAMPTYTLMQVEDGGDHFTVRMAADCRMGKVDFSWKGVVTGAADGTITFHAEGTPNADFDSNRIGLCVLYGNAALATHSFETDGTPADGTFPALVSPTLVGSQFHKLQYTTDAGLHVSCSLDGAIFDVEDQRNWGDSSWKAYAPLPYAYKQVGKGDVKSQTVTLTVSGVNAANSTPTARPDPIRVTLGQPIEGATIPVILPSGSIDKPVAFTDISFNHQKFADKTRIDWSYIPTSHLPDDDTIMENLPAVTDQAKTILSFNHSQPVLRVGPIKLEATGDDPRGDMPIGAAWVIGMVHSLANGHVQAAEFGMKGKMATAALAAIRPYANWQLIEVETAPMDSTDVLAFGCFKQNSKVLFLVNKRSQISRVDLPTGSRAVVLHLTTGNEDTPVGPAAGDVSIVLQPSEVCRVTLVNPTPGN